jgi:signal transduction histidine kinase
MIKERTRELSELNEKLVQELEEREKMKEEIEKINVELEGFAQTVSHDLRGPFATVMGANLTLQSLMRGYETEEFPSELREATEMIDRAVCV